MFDSDAKQARKKCIKQLHTYLAKQTEGKKQQQNKQNRKVRNTLTQKQMLI